VVEPERHNFQQLADDEVLRGAPNLHLVKKAAWSSKARMDLIVSQDPADHKIEVSDISHDNDFVPGNYVGTESVDADTVDNIAADFEMPVPDFVEIHVNGAELEVLKGMPRTLANTKRIHVKGHAIETETKQPINVHVEKILNENGFRTIVARPSAARDEATDWGKRAGDVYGARFS
jgi:FkbM family methyltransferase